MTNIKPDKIKLIITTLTRTYLTDSTPQISLPLPRAASAPVDVKEIDDKALAGLSLNLRVVKGPSKKLSAMKAPQSSQRYYYSSEDLLPKISKTSDAKINGYIEELNKISLEMTYEFLTDKNNLTVMEKQTGGKVIYNRVGKKNNIDFPKPNQVRRLLVQPVLFKLVHFAFLLTNEAFNDLDHIVIYSGGQFPLYEAGKTLKIDQQEIKVPPRLASRTIRHDKGFACDVRLKDKSGKNMSLKKEKDAKIIKTFARYCYMLGAHGIGAHAEYSKGIGFHIDIAKRNIEVTGENSPYKSITLDQLDSVTKRKILQDISEDKFVSNLSQLIAKKIKHTNNVKAWGRGSSARGKNLAPWLKALRDEHSHS